jgi:hypothetical protein
LDSSFSDFRTLGIGLFFSILTYLTLFTPQQQDSGNRQVTNQSNAGYYIDNAIAFLSKKAHGTQSRENCRIENSGIICD